MKEKRYKAVYITKLDIEQKIGNEFYNLINLKQKIRKEIESYNIRILGDDFVKNNLNKAKLIINNKKNKLKGIINGIKTKDGKIKINILLNNKLVNFSHMFENSILLKEISFYNKDKSNILDGEYSKAGFNSLPPKNSNSLNLKFMADFPFLLNILLILFYDIHCGRILSNFTIML